MRKEWTEEEVKTLRYMRAYRASFSTIAKKLGRTKNSVVGKATKLKLNAKPKYSSPSSPRRFSFEEVTSNTMA